MKYFKKRALALVLASVITVAGSFSAEKYSNHLTGVEFREASGSNVEFVLKTAREYEGTISPRRMDTETYLIMLPGVDGGAAINPDISNVSGYVKSVECKTFPYTQNSNGYTKIVIRTFGRTNLSVSNEVALPQTTQPELIEDKTPKETEDTNVQTKVQQKQTSQYSDLYGNGKSQTNQTFQPVSQTTETSKPEPVFNTEDANINKDNDVQDINYDNNTSSDTMHQYLLILGALLVIITSIYIYIKGKDRLNNIIGEKLEIDLEDEEEKKKKKEKGKKEGKIRKTIRKLDSMYSKTSSMPVIGTYNNTQSPTQTEEQTEEPVNIVDLDELFREQTSAKEEENNTALDDFLSEFALDDSTTNTELETVEDEAPAFSESDYESVLSSDLKFSDADIECVNLLLNSEINQNTIDNISDYLVSNPVKPSEDELRLKKFEELITDYTITQNIVFSDEDIETIKALMSVELDENFVKDLRVNPKRTKQMEAEIKNHNTSPIKVSKNLTLKVKDMLPNLSEELRNQGNNPIKYERKAETVYYSEGWEYTKLEVSDSLKNLTQELKNISESSEDPIYDLDALTKKYDDENKDTQVIEEENDVHDEYEGLSDKEIDALNEKALMDRISNVHFKPFDDGASNFEVLNDPNEIEKEDPFAEYRDLPSVYDESLIVQNDIKSEEKTDTEAETQTEDLEPEETSETEAETQTEEIQIEETHDTEAEAQTEEVQIEEESEVIEQSLADNEILPVTENEQKIEEEIITVSETENKTPEINIAPLKILEKEKFSGERSSKSQELINRIENAKKEREEKRKSLMSEKNIEALRNEAHKAIVKHEFSRCSLDGSEYEILSSTALKDGIGCHLAKGANGYTVIAYSGNSLKVIKEYPSLKSEKIQGRLSETSNEGIQRFLIRIGNTKFVADLIDNNLNFVMDLC